jgi:cystathionine beta-lyase
MQPRRPGLATRLTHAGRPGVKTHGYVNPPVARGSTVLYPDMAARLRGWEHKFEQALSYGLTGGETHFALEDMVAEIEGGTRCQLVSSGLAAVTAAMLAYAAPGACALVPDSAYGPTRSFCDEFLARFGVRTDYYVPTIGGAELSRLLRPQTAFVYLESPGSQTFEVQDVPALAAAAHAGGAAVLMDNTWGFSAFDPFAHGVDVSIQALTKYAGGHSDVLLGAIVTREPEHWERVRATSLLLGHSASPDDCWLVLRGLRTLGVRTERQLASSLTVARWLAERPEVAQVRHPALPGAPGHALWARDFTGGASLFGVELSADLSPAATCAMVEAMQLFGIGASWGGFESLALPITGFVTRTADPHVSNGPMIRLHIGLEDPADLIADLELGFSALNAHAGGCIP